MARDFASASISCGSDTTIDDCLSGGGSLGIWINVDSVGGGAGGFVQQKRGSSGNVGWFHRVENASGATMDLKFFNGFTTDGRWVTTSRDITTGTWYFVGWSYNSDSTTNDPILYLNTVKKTVGSGLTENLAPTGAPSSDAANTFIIGDYITAGQYFDGKLGHNSMWSSQCTDNEMLAMAHGIPPFVINNSSLTIYNPLHGNDSPEGDYIAQTSKGTLTNTTKSTGPPVELLENYL